MNPKAYRLPHTVIPRHYSIEIDARVGREELLGNVTIQLDIMTPCSAIELHAREMRIHEATVEAGGRTLAGTVTLDADREVAVIEMPEELPRGPAKLHLEYVGRVSSGLVG